MLQMESAVVAKAAAVLLGGRNRSPSFSRFFSRFHYRTQAPHRGLFHQPGLPFGSSALCSSTAWVLAQRILRARCLSNRADFVAVAGCNDNSSNAPQSCSNGGISHGEGNVGIDAPKTGMGTQDTGPPSSNDIIILDVADMSCAGCVANVKRVLENQPQVSSANVSLTAELAVVWPVAEAKTMRNWKESLGEALAKHLTSTGYNSTYRASVEDNIFHVFGKKMEVKRNLLKESGRRLAVSWAIFAICLFGHLSQMFGLEASWLHALHSASFHLSFSLLTLLGPGRQIIVNGLKNLLNGIPNMNTLICLGSLSSFAFSTAAVLLPDLGWEAFFEEPIMLIAFVLLGRNLENRAKIKAASDMTSLLSILPPRARLLLDSDNLQDPVTMIEVPSSNLSTGDQIAVLPGDRVPADGIVKNGRSTIDESILTGEFLPVVKLPGAEVVAGSINLDGTLHVEVSRPGFETVLGDAVHFLEQAQIREAPVQKLADKVAGKFTIVVMVLSAATFLFWSTFALHILPALDHAGNTSLALQLSSSVLVVACPCALGLATPTAVLVGTSLGTTRGLFLRGGDVLEKCSLVNTVVFDKTGTLTVGRPKVTRIISQYDNGSYSKSTFSEVDVLRLAAGVEMHTTHPVGRAIVEAARAANCGTAKVMHGTFFEEPGSGSVAHIEGKVVSVGTLEWVQRFGAACQSNSVFEEPMNQTVIYVGVGDMLGGFIYLSDQIRDDAEHVVQYLHKLGVGVYILSGDQRNAVEYVASVVGIPKNMAISCVKPNEKKVFVSKLKNEKNIVAMVGDGINDIAALASSDIGIAMGHGASGAREVSSVVLLGNKLSQLIEVIELSKLAMMTVKQNLCWAFVYNMVGIPVAAGALLPVTGTSLTPSIAGALMGFSSLGVMANSLLLRYKFASKLKRIF